MTSEMEKFEKGQVVIDFGFFLTGLTHWFCVRVSVRACVPSKAAL